MQANWNIFTEKVSRRRSRTRIETDYSTILENVMFPWRRTTTNRTVPGEGSSLGAEMDSLPTSNGHSVNDDSPYTPHDVDKIRRSLKYNFMTPCEKYKARGRKPWKLVLQLVKLVIVTLQVVALGTQRQHFVDFSQKTKLSLQHIMFKDWDVSHETLPYPPAVGVYALYTQQEVLDHLNYAMDAYNTTPSTAIGIYGFPESQFSKHSRSADLCITSLKIGNIFPQNATYELDPRLDTDCVIFEPTHSPQHFPKYNVEALLHKHNKTFQISRIHKIELKFALMGIQIKQQSTIEPFDAPDCLYINGTILYDNTLHDGQMLVDLLVNVTSLDCTEDSLYEKDQDVEIGLTVTFDVFVIVICLASCISCVRSLVKSLALLKETKIFFKQHFKYTLTRDEQMHFVNGWFIIIGLSDMLTIAGSGIKMAILFKKQYLYDTSSMLLGTANILVWLGVLRYLGYFSKYNILILTIKNAAPDVLRFLLCAAVFYFAFTFCGWLVLGPYHMKFMTIATTSECLFSLVNGDDMFVTFSIINEKAPYAIWLFSRVYLYVFNSVFIYFILNVFVSVIIDTYETIKMYTAEGFPKTVVEKFMDECPDAVNSPLFISDLSRTKCTSCFSCCKRRNRSEPLDDTENILT